MRKRSKTRARYRARTRDDRQNAGSYKFYDPKFTPTSEHDIFDKNKTQDFYNRQNKENRHNKNSFSYSNYDGYNQDYNQFSYDNNRRRRGNRNGFYSLKNTGLFDLAMKGFRQVAKEGIFTLKDLLIGRRR